jgi:5-methylcytosine-specific restriction endonuclease McrA
MTKYRDPDCKDKVWNLAKRIPDKNPNIFRQDPYGNQICKNSYGTQGKQSWDIDHIKPQSRGGSDHIRNLQALQSSVNRSKGNSLVKKSRHNA